MSYILDALRKADAERDRGNVPGIHAQPSFGGAAPARAAPASRPWLWLASGALAVLIAGGVAWYLTGASRAPVVAAVAPAPVPVAVAPAPVAPVASVAAVETAKPAAPTPTPPAARKPKPATATVAATASAPAAAGSKPAASGEKVYTVAELPDDIRRQLPNVTVGGSMYSPKPADRILIINGQVLHEGERIAPDLELQQIRLKSALLNFKGYRYAIAF
jgi:general secretion pathway protein B